MEMYFVIVEAIVIAVLLLLLLCVKCGGVTRKYITFCPFNSYLFPPLPSLLDIMSSGF